MPAVVVVSREYCNATAGIMTNGTPLLHTCKMDERRCAAASKVELPSLGMEMGLEISQ